MCGCEHHADQNAPCTCKCPDHEGVRREMERREETAKILGPSMRWVDDARRRAAQEEVLTKDGQANDCTHQCATGVDQALVGPNKVWRCDHCGLQYTSGGEVLVDGTWFPWGELPKVLANVMESERRAWSDAKRMATRLEAVKNDRHEWADYFERWLGAVGPTPPTVEAVIAALRAPSRPFGRAAGSGQ